MAGEEDKESALAKPSALSGGIWAFTTIWVGQLVSELGSGLTSFTLGVWVYQRTGSATKFTLIALFASLPGLIILPLAGALTDRLERRHAMIFCNLAAAFSTLALAWFFLTGRLALWHIYLIVIFISTFSTFLNLIYTTSITVLMPKEHYGRASGMVQFAQASAQIIPPFLAGILIVTIQVKGIILIDFLTYVVAILTLLPVRIPKPQPTAEAQSKGRVWRDAFYGWTYIKARPGLLSLLVYFAVLNFIVGMAHVLFAPLILSFTTAEVLGTVMSVSGMGFLIGSLVMSVWGGPARRVSGILGSGVLFGLCVVLVGLRSSVPLISAAAFGMFFLLPILNGCSQAIWQIKTPPDVQGRVFAVRWMLALSATPLAYLLAGLLADKLFAPLAQDGGLFGGLAGAGPARGIGLMFVLAGSLTMLVQFVAYFYQPLKRVEAELPDAVAAQSLGRNDWAGASASE